MLIVQGPAVEVLQAVGKVVSPHPVLFDAPPALVLPPVLVVPPGAVAPPADFEPPVVPVQ